MVTHRALVVFVAAIGIGAVTAMALLWPGERPAPPPANPAQTTTTHNATLVAVREVPGAQPPGIARDEVVVMVRARLDDSGEEVEFQTTDDTGGLVRPGQKVRLSEIQQAGVGTTYYIVDFRRAGSLVVLTALFVAAVVWFGRLQGLRALLGLALTFLVIVGFMIPALLDGRSPLAVAVAGSVLIMIVTLYLSHGFTAKTTAAVVGTTLALVITGALSVAFVNAADITGLASEEARMASVQVAGLSLRGLLLAGIVIGGLGVLDDVTMSQSSIVFQLHRAKPGARFRELTTGALAVGRDHIAATVNTLFLAYAGASLPLLILFAGSPDGLGSVVTSEIVAVEIVRTLVGSVGLIAAVPLTTALAAMLVLGEPSSTRAGPRGRHEERLTPHGEPQVIRAAANSTSDIPDEEEWERRLREAYRIPPDKEQQ